MKNSAKMIDNKEVQSTENVQSTKVDANVLDALNSLNISDKIVEKIKQSIFKKEFQTKAFRTKCRNILIKEKKVELDGTNVITYVGLIPQYLNAFKKKDKAECEKYLSQIKAECKIYYSAEDSFKNASDYYTSGRGEEIRKYISIFIDLQKSK